jgi:hypothetical protein
MPNLSVSKVQRKTKNDPQPTLSENFNSHPLFSGLMGNFSNTCQDNRSLCIIACIPDHYLEAIKINIHARIIFILCKFYWLLIE